MISLSGNVCLNHAGREAVARCPGCGQSYCRECITEHDDRVLCTACLRKLTRVETKRSPWLVPLLRAGQVVASLLVAWAMFHLAARTLLSIPTDFHDGTIWKRSVFED